MDLGLLSVSGAALPADAVKTLAALTADVGFNYVVLLSDGKTVHAAATDSTCHRPIDLAFLVDGSGSISQADYTRALGKSPINDHVLASQAHSVMLVRGLSRLHYYFSVIFQC